MDQASEIVLAVTLALTVAIGTIALLVTKHRKSARTTVVRKSIQIELNQGEVPDAVFHTGDNTHDAATVPGFEFEEIRLGEADDDLDSNDVFQAAKPTLVGAGGKKSIRPWLKLARPSWQAPPPSPARSPAPARRNKPGDREPLVTAAAAAPRPFKLARSSPRRCRTVNAAVHPTKHGLGLILAEGAAGLEGGTCTDTCTIGKVVPGGPGYVARLAAGDELVAINGVAVVGLGMQEVKQRLTMAAVAARLGGTAVELVAKRYLHVSRSALEGGVRFSPPSSPVSSTKTFDGVTA